MSNVAIKYTLIDIVVFHYIPFPIIHSVLNNGSPKTKVWRSEDIKGYKRAYTIDENMKNYLLLKFEIQYPGIVTNVKRTLSTYTN